MSFFERTRLTDASGNLINPAERQELYTYDPPDLAAAPAVRTAPGSLDDQLALTRRILKVLEAQSAVDGNNRQRMIVDNAALPPLVTGANTIGNVGLVAGVNIIGQVSNVQAIAGWNQQMFADWARQSYNTGIRSRLTF